VKIIVTADGLCPNQPFVDELKAANMSFILVAKTGKVTYQNNWVTDIEVDANNESAWLKATGHAGKRNPTLRHRF
jgi:hypothetical protein